MRQRRIWHSPNQEATRRERSGREQSPATPTELPESRPASCPPYKMTFSSGTSAIQRPSTSRSSSIVSFIATAYHRWFRIADSERWPSISGAAGSGGCGRGPEDDFRPGTPESQPFPSAPSAGHNRPRGPPLYPSSGGKLGNDLRPVAPRHRAYLIIPKRIDHVARNRLLNVIQHSVRLRLRRPGLTGVRPCVNEGQGGFACGAADRLHDAFCLLAGFRNYEIE